MTDPRLRPEALAALRQVEDEVMADGVTLRAGDVQVWEIPDSHRDTRSERPVLRFEAEVPVRITAIDRAGRALHDEVLAEGEVTVPLGTARLAVALTGAPTGPAGWHIGARLVRISPTTLLCQQGLVRSEAASTRRGGRESATGLVPAGDVVPLRGTVETTLPAATRTVVVGLSPTTTDADVDGFAMTLQGAARDEAEPTVVRVGDRVYGLFAVTADDGAATVTASVRTDERWSLAGVLGSVEDLATTADWLAAGGLSRVRGTVTTPTGLARVRWKEPHEEEAR